VAILAEAGLVDNESSRDGDIVLLCSLNWNAEV